MKSAVRYLSGFLLAALCCHMVGCAVFQASDVRTEYAGMLDDGKTLLLVQEIERDMLRKGSNNNHSTLWLRIMAKDELVWQEPIGRISGCYDEAPAFTLGDLEGRRSPDHQLVWVIERQPSRVIAAVNRANGHASGMNDELPKWARVDAGIPLHPAQE